MNTVNKVFLGTLIVTLATSAANIYSYIAYMHPLFKEQKERVMYNEYIEFNKSGVTEHYVQHHTIKLPNLFVTPISTTTRIHQTRSQSVVFRYTVAMHPNLVTSSKQVITPQQIIIPQGSISELFPTEAESHFYRSNKRNYYKHLYLSSDQKIWCYSMISLDNIVCMRDSL